MTTALVTGASGFVGSFLVDQLLDRDREVRCVVRRSSNLRWLKGKPVDFLPWDLLQDPPPEDRLEDVEEVYHAAGLLTAHRKQSFFRVNALGVERLLNALHDAGAPVDRFLLVSSLAAAGPSPDRTVRRETQPCEPVSNYGKSKREGERRLLRSAGNYDYTIVRPPVIMGPRDQMMLDMVEMVQNDVVPKFGRYKKYSFIHVSDLVRGICRAVSSDRARNETYFLSHPDPIEWESFLREIGRVLGRDPMILPVPDRMATVLATVGQYVDGLPGLKESFTRDKALEMEQRAWLCSPEKARTHVDFQCSMDFDETVENTVRWYRNKGWLAPAENGAPPSSDSS